MVSQGRAWQPHHCPGLAVLRCAAEVCSPTGHSACWGRGGWGGMLRARLLLVPHLGTKHILTWRQHILGDMVGPWEVEMPGGGGGGGGVGPVIK